MLPYCMQSFSICLINLCCTRTCPAQMPDKIRMVAGRLEDKAAIVRKCALQLLSKLLSFNPFGRYLPLDQMTASLNEYQAKLQACPVPAVLDLLLIR